MKNVLIVGGAGYIGGYLTDILQDEYHVTVYDNLLFEPHYLKNVNFVFGDVRDTRKLKPHLDRSDIVVWLAAVVGDGACAVDKALTRTINLECVHWLTQNFKGKIIFTSTCSVYGANDEWLDEFSATNPLSLYGETKLRAETPVLETGKGLVFRLGTLFGLGDESSRIRLDLVVNLLTYRGFKKEPLKVFGGEQWRPLLHVKDVTGAIRFGIENNLSGLFNLADRNMTIGDIAEFISMWTESPVVYDDIPFEDKRNYKVSSSRLRNLGWNPNCTLKEGVLEMLQLFRDGRVKNPDNPIYSNVSFMKKLYGMS
jgi:nucleoside-diphosphate-sugar epimerase